MKKIFAVLLAAIMALTLGGCTRAKWTTEPDEELGGLTITGWWGWGAEQTEIGDVLEIPSQIGEKPVYSIGDRAFYFSDVSGVIISEGIKKIGYCAFKKCYSLVSVNIPSSVTEISEYAFQSCSKLESIVIPDGVTVIGEDAFSGCVDIVVTYKGNTYDFEHINDLYAAING